LNTNQLANLFRAYSVKRYHTLPTILSQTVGDHTARVLVLVHYLSLEPPNSNLVLAVLEHDGYEHLTGDIPATAKWMGNFADVVEKLEQKIDTAGNMNFNAYNLLTEEEKLLLKIADMTELCCWASMEAVMGNRGMEVIFQNGIKYLDNLQDKMPKGMWERIAALLGPKPQATPAPAH